MAEDATQDEELEESSTSETDEESEESSTSTPSEASTEESPAEEEPEEEVEEKVVPFHEHPRFQQLIEKNRSMEEELQRMRDARTEQEQVSQMSSEERAVHDLKKKYGFATKDDLADVKKQNAMLKDQLEFEKFLTAKPEAASRAKAIKAVAYTKEFSSKSYNEIYTELFGAEEKRKVVSRRVKTGIKAKSTGSKSTDAGSFTRSQISNMSAAEFKKNEAKIFKEMAEGKIK